MGVFESVTRGGQTWAHRMRMLKQVLRLIFLGSLTSCLLFFVGKLSLEPQERFQAVYYLLKASLPSTTDRISVSGDFWSTITHKASRKKPISVPKRQITRACKPHADHLKNKAFHLLREVPWIFLITSSLLLLFFLLKGLASKRQKHLKGTRLEKSWKIKLKMTLTRQKSDLKMGSIPLLKNSETQHMLICGATGTGKTNALRQLISQIRKRGERAVIIDTTGDFVTRFYHEEKDILFNPYDPRSKTWHPWCECQHDYQFKQLVSSLIPKNTHAYDDFFPEAARAVIFEMLMKHHHLEHHDIEGFVQDLLTKSVSELYQDLKDTEARIYVDPEGERTAVSIRATIANSIRHLTTLKNSPDPFSIREWILSEKTNMLFLSCQPEQREALNVLMSVWLSTAFNAMRARTPKKTWFIIDELHSLQKLEYLEETLAELRKYGGAIVLATQNISQLDKIYGHHGAKIILDQCATKVSFRQSDLEIAKRMSGFFGQREFQETREGLSYGAHQMRDGVNLSNLEKTKATVTPTEILNLPDLEAFIKLPGNYPALKTKFFYKD
ncbi:helicase HerA-like domain-containing protein [Candidatus Neptunochlamydia vexilliferae]|uniref:Type IV secretion system coupling protein TraD DNA-binding domain-containing protein n=1 Tax=Candidatus Neptunichlamydia vexilliferae TaxID=1651774 RepID=A0ABS0AY65_9BACT|nr:helicase HerA-like domain-containing protein [Candidatus Neptunochlamydia vexilliferae]MBF5059074.1 hypothetical protein [Candidatus Neptunochlamydia vexilliferae]